MSHKLFELDVRLRGIKPPIWRTVQVPGAASLEDVHLVLQIAMGWTNSHLHQFVIGKRRYGMADVDDFGGPPTEDERQFRLQDVARAGASFTYEYDFGDGWEHAIKVKKVTTVAKAPPPRLVAGARACPPEDCGGPGGYDYLLEALADPAHPAHEDKKEWIGDFEPEDFEVPPKGVDLGRAMARLAALAAGEDEGEDDAADDDPDGGGDMLDDPAGLAGLPRDLLQAVLSLDAIQRANLVALVASSLAHDVLDLHEQLTAAPPPAPRPPPRRAPRGPR